MKPMGGRTWKYWPASGPVLTVERGVSSRGRINYVRNTGGRESEITPRKENGERKSDREFCPTL